MENAGGGTDSVFASANYRLGNAVEQSFFSAISGALKPVALLGSRCRSGELK